MNSEFLYIFYNIINKKMLTATQSASSVLYRALLKHNIKNVMIYTGGAIMPFVDMFHPNNNYGRINHYTSANEFCMGSTAVGYGKYTGKPLLCLVTSGPGMTNMITPIADAFKDNSPMFVISGQVASPLIGKHAFQEIPATDLTKSITTWSRAVNNPHNIQSLFSTGYNVASNNGVVHMDIPKDIFTRHIMYSDVDTENTQQKSTSYNDIKKIGEIINKSKQPVIIVGKGCQDASEELRKFAIRTHIPVASTLHGVGIFDETHPLSLKFSGMHGAHYANNAIQNADCIIGIGNRFDDRNIGNPNSFGKNAKHIICVNNNPDAFNKLLIKSTNILMDCRDFLNELNEYVAPSNNENWINKITDLKYRYPFQHSSYGNLLAQQVLSILNHHIKSKDNVVITTGVGNHQMFTAQFLTYRRPRQLITSGSLGCMGVGLPYAIGVQIADPSKDVICIDGDQSFNMSLNDLKTVSNYNFKIKIIIMNNGQMSMVNSWEQLFYNNRQTATITKNPNYKKIAEAYGIKYLTCDNHINANTMIKEFVNSKESVILDARISPSLCYPFVKPNSDLDAGVYQ